MKPVAICTTRNGQPYVVFGAHLDGNSRYGTSGKTFAEVVADRGEAEVQVYLVEDGPDLAKWEALFEQMERDGVTMVTGA
jgi:hypothetical protein